MSSPTSGARSSAGTSTTAASASRPSTSRPSCARWWPASAATRSPTHSRIGSPRPSGRVRTHPSRSLDARRSAGRPDLRAVRPAATTTRVLLAHHGSAWRPRLAHSGSPPLLVRGDGVSVDRRASSPVTVVKVVLPKYPPGRVPAPQSLRRKYRRRPRRCRGGASVVAPTAVDWALAERVAVRAAGTEPFARSYHADSLVADFDELTARAEEQVAADDRAAQPGRSGPGPGRRPRRLGPGQHRLVPAAAAPRHRPAREKVGRTGRRPRRPQLAGAEVGALLGWMSGRVLGQYDLLVIEDEDPEEQDLVHYVGPNILALEKRFAFPPREFRQWLALHEVTHRMQFTGVPWMREHFLGLVDGMVWRGRPGPGSGCSRRSPGPPRRSARAATRSTTAGLAALFAAARASEAARPDRRADEPAGGPRRRHHGPGRRRPDPQRGALRPGAAPARASRCNPAVKLLQKLIGLDAKLKQYEQGERFIEAVEEVGGAGRPRPGLGGPGQPADHVRDPRPAGVARPGAASSPADGLLTV